MNGIEHFLENLACFSQKPRPFGTFHIVSVCVVLALCVVMVLFRKKLPRGERALRTVLIVFGVTFICLEAAKQVICSYCHYEYFVYKNRPDDVLWNVTYAWAYDWTRFPFQFCSSPIYVTAAAMLSRDGKFRRTLLCFLSTYVPVAGCAVLFWPSPSVFSPIIFLDVHTMLWHGMMLILGLYLWLSGAVYPEWRTLVRSLCVYFPFCAVAILLNEIEHITGFAGGAEFNMFYISRFYKCTIPVISSVQQYAPFYVYWLSYIALLGFGGVFVVALMMTVKRVAGRKKRDSMLWQLYH